MRYTESTDLSFMFGSDHFIYDNYEEEVLAPILKQID